MALLTQSKQQVDQQFGSSTPASNLIGGFFDGEQAFQYDLGQFQVIVGFYQNIARYACFTKATLADQAFTPIDVTTCLMMIDAPADWKSSVVADASPAAASTGGHGPAPVVIGGTGVTTQYQCTIKDADGNSVGVLAWHRTTKPYVFAYCPMMAPPQRAIAASPAQIDKNFGQG